MYELFPVLAGVLVGLLVWRLPNQRQRAATLVVACLAIGAVAAFVSGELFESWVFLLLDTVLALLAAGVTLAVASWWQRRRLF